MVSPIGRIRSPIRCQVLKLSITASIALNMATIPCDAATLGAHIAANDTLRIRGYGKYGTSLCLRQAVPLSWECTWAVIYGCL